MSYVDTFIRVAPDSKATAGVAPSPRGAAKTIAELEYGMLSANPYRHVERDVQFEVHLVRLGLTPGELRKRRATLEAEFFARPRACFRASPLPKKFGWGVHYDGQGRIALYAVDSDEYRRLSEDESLTQLYAMRTSRSA